MTRVSIRKDQEPAETWAPRDDTSWTTTAKAAGDLQNTLGVGRSYVVELVRYVVELVR